MAVATSREDAENIISKLATEKADITFSIKVGRSTPNGIPVSIAHMSGAKAAHLLSPETWLPQFAGGGQFVLTVLDPSAPPSANKILAMLRCDGRGQVWPAVDLKAVEREDWNGPAQITWSNAAGIPAVPGAQASDGVQPLASVSTLPTRSAAPAIASADPAIAALQADVLSMRDAMKSSEQARIAAEARAGELERQRAADAVENRHKEELARVRNEAKTAADTARAEAKAAAEAQQKQIDALAARINTPPAQTGPSAVELLMKMMEKQEADRKAEALRAEELRKWQTERDEKREERFQQALEKAQAPKPNAQIEGLEKIGTAIGSIVGTLGSAMQTMVDINKMNAPGETPESTADIIRAVGEAVGSFRGPRPSAAPRPADGSQPQQQLPQNAETQPPPESGDDGQPVSGPFLESLAVKIEQFGEPTLIAKSFFDMLTAPGIDAIRLRRVMDSHETFTPAAVELFGPRLEGWYTEDRAKADEYLAKLEKAVDAEYEARVKVATAAATKPNLKAVPTPPASA